jgi:class 3 adenylate cyclase
VSDDADLAADASSEALHKEIARLRRRVGRLEDQLEQVDTYRDTNAKALNRVNDELAVEKARSHALLLNVLPEAIIQRLDRGEQLIADRYDDVAIVFSDFVGFTAISTRLEVSTLVSSLNGLFSAFDAACAEFGVEKIKTIGDAYMAAGGLPTPNSTHPLDVVRAALEVRDFIAEGKARKVAAGLP